MFLFHIHRSTIECPALVSAGKALIDSGHSGSGHSAKLTGKLALLNMPLIQSEAGAGFSFGGGGQAPRSPKVPPIQNRKLVGVVPLFFSKELKLSKKSKRKNFYQSYRARARPERARPRHEGLILGLRGPIPGLRRPISGLRVPGSQA